jgi:hypothetical protein
MMNYYDYKQICVDVSKIVAMCGAKEQQGFFTRGVYRTNGIKLIDVYDGFPTIFVDGVCIDSRKVKMNSAIGSWILNTVSRLEDLSPKFYKINNRGGHTVTMFTV